MNTLHLKYAVEVERTGSITQAADNLFMAQPNLSKAIKELEETLGIAIFERTPKGMMPTEKGREFLSHARRALSEVRAMERLGGKTSDDKLRLALPRSTYAARAAAGFASRARGGAVIMETGALEALNLISDGKAELCVISFSTSFDRYFFDYMKDKRLEYDQVWEYQPMLTSLKGSSHITEIAFLGEEAPGAPAGSERSARRVIEVSERQTFFDMLASVPDSFGAYEPLFEPGNFVQRLSTLPTRRDLIVREAGEAMDEAAREFVDMLFECRNNAEYR